MNKIFPDRSVMFYNLNFLNLNEFPATETELKLMAAAAIIGLKNTPQKKRIKIVSD